MKLKKLDGVSAIFSPNFFNKGIPVLIPGTI